MFTKLHQMRRREEGFTLIELLIVVAIIGIIAAILIPNLLDAINKARQRRTVSDIRTMGTAWMSWVNDAVSATAAGQQRVWDSEGLTSIEPDDFAELMNPSESPHYYLADPPTRDGFGNDYLFWLNQQGEGFSLDAPATWRTIIQFASILAVQSPGRNNEEEDTIGAGDIDVHAFPVTDYDCNIIWGDGFFVRWPEGLGGGEAGSGDSQDCTGG